MRVTVLYFAGLRDRTGRREEGFELERGAGLAELRKAVLERHRILEEMASRVRWAVNESYAEADHPLSDGDQIALIPPVSGG